NLLKQYYSTDYVFVSNDTLIFYLYTLSLHDALPISGTAQFHPDGLTVRGETMFTFADFSLTKPRVARVLSVEDEIRVETKIRFRDRKSTRLNSSHVKISYAVFCLKKKTQIKYLKKN